MCCSSLQLFEMPFVVSLLLTQLTPHPLKESTPSRCADLDTCDVAGEPRVRPYPDLSGAPAAAAGLAAAGVAAAGVAAAWTKWLQWGELPAGPLRRQVA